MCGCVVWRTTRETDDRAPLTPEPHTHGVSLGAREWLWRAEGWLMHATTIAPQHAVALCTLAPPPPPPWHRSGERHRCFARTGAETFSGSGARLIVRTSRTASLSLSLCATLSLFVFNSLFSHHHFIEIGSRSFNGVFPALSLTVSCRCLNAFDFLWFNFLTKHWQKYRSSFSQRDSMDHSSFGLWIVKTERMYRFANEE